MQHYWVVQIRQQVYTICSSRTIASFIKDHHVFFVRKSSNWTTKWDLWRNWTTLWRKRTTNCWSLLMSGVKSVLRHKEASAGGGSFVPQGGLIAQHSLALGFRRTTYLAISTRVVLPRTQVVLNKQICGPYKTNIWSLHRRWSKLCDLL